MPLLVDGHNLIGKMSTLSLDDPNDEAELVLRLRTYRARTNKLITVIFDHGLPGGASKLSGGGVQVVFASGSATADKLILHRVRRHKDPASLVVVSSDQEIARAAEAAGARALSSEQFATQLEDDDSPAPDAAEADAPVVSEAEVEDWLRLFGQR
jgi:predicted RNA-binding protein with PIN domain